MWIVNSAILLAAGIAFAVYDQAQMRKHLIEELRAGVELIADDCAEALEGRPHRAAPALAKLKSYPRVVACRLYNSHGAAMATGGDAGHPLARLPAVLNATSGFRAEFDGRRLVLQRPVVAPGGQTAGIIHAVADAEELTDRQKGFGLALGSVAVSLLAITWFVSATLRRSRHGHTVESLIDALPLPAVLLKEEGSLLAVNRTFAATFGFTRIDFPNSEAWWQRICPDGNHRAEFEGWLRSMSVAGQSANASEAPPHETRVTCRDGSIRVVEWRATRVGPGTLLVGSDVTALREAHAHTARERALFEFVFETVPVGLSLFGLHSKRPLLVNAADQRITGVSSTDPNWLNSIVEATHPEDRERQKAVRDRFFRGEINHYTIEKRYVHADGRVVWATLTSRWFVDPMTTERQVATVLVDITARKGAEAELERTHRQLLEVSRRAGMAEIASSVLHDVGNVLNSVNVSVTCVGDAVRQLRIDRVDKLAALLREHADDLAAFLAVNAKGRQVSGFLDSLAKELAQQQSALLEEIASLRSNIEHIKEIVARQQDYTGVSGVLETLPVATIVDEALQINAEALARHRVALTRDFQANPAIEVDRHKLLQILVNLVGNAKHACSARNPPGHITVRITADENLVAIAVIDNGVGIEVDHLTRIFNQGFSTRKGGRGFGLHGSALLAAELRGGLTAHSDGPDRGAVFTLRLPAVRPLKTG